MSRELLIAVTWGQPDDERAAYVEKIPRPGDVLDFDGTRCLVHSVTTRDSLEAQKHPSKPVATVLLSQIVGVVRARLAPEPER